MAIPIVSVRGTTAGADFFVACFSWMESHAGFCQVDAGLSLAKLVDRAEAWLASGRACVSVEIWLGARLCVFLRGSSGNGPEDVLSIGFPLAPGVYRWDDAEEVYKPAKRSERRALLAEGSGPA